MSGIWTQSLRGYRIDLVDPVSNTIDFGEIAHTLSHVNRYAGASALPVSVALHTIAGMTACEAKLLPWWLIHDAHEAYITDIPTPVAQALAEIADRQTVFGAQTIRKALRELKHRHDEVIHEAAGLSLPTAEQHERLKAIDLIATKTERRDFLSEPPEPWNPAVEAAQALPSEIAYTPAGIAARTLLKAFWKHLPIYSGEPSQGAA